MSSHQCYYSLCDKCDSKECSCNCHKKRSDFYERLDKNSKRSTNIVTNIHDRHRGRPAKVK